MVGTSAAGTSSAQLSDDPPQQQLQQNLRAQHQVVSSLPTPSQAVSEDALPSTTSSAHISPQEQPPPAAQPLETAFVVLLVLCFALIQCAILYYANEHDKAKRREQAVRRKRPRTGEVSYGGPGSSGGSSHVAVGGARGSAAASAGSSKLQRAGGGLGPFAL